ncbi:MAG: type II toxin-antitoxin system VapC family toxin [Desulfobacteraceae bacterium]
MGGDFVVDNSVVMAWCFLDENNALADTALDTLTHASAFVPSIWPLEVVNVLLVAERRKRIRVAESVRFLELLGQLPIRVEMEPAEQRMGELLQLARDHTLSSYDASYLDLAMRRGLPLATVDHELVRAAQDRHVPLFSH